MEKKKPIILEGYSIVFNKPSVILHDRMTPYREIIDPCCITQDFVNSQDIVLNIRHNNDKVIARSKQGRGDLQIRVDSKGVFFHVEYDPEEDIFDAVAEARALVKRGVLSNCSFEFLAYPDEDTTSNEFSRDADGTQIIRRKRIYALTALTIAAYPAYESTSVNTREQHRAYGFTEREIKIMEAEPTNTLQELKYQKARVEALVMAAEARESAGAEINIDEKLKAKARLHELESQIKRLTT